MNKFNRIVSALAIAAVSAGALMSLENASFAAPRHAASKARHSVVKTSARKGKKLQVEFVRKSRKARKSSHKIRTARATRATKKGAASQPAAPISG